MSRDLLIYALFDPRSGLARYVGLSTRGMARPKTHLRRVPKDDVTWRANWLRELKAEGLQPEIRIVEYCEDTDDLCEAERYWITYFREAGCPLTNLAAGGIAPPEFSAECVMQRSEARRGKPLSLEHCRAISESKRGRLNPMFARPVSDETRRKRAESMRGTKNHHFGIPVAGGDVFRFRAGQPAWNKGLPGLSGESHPMFGKHHSEATRQRISASNLGHQPWNKGLVLSDEHRAAMSAARAGKPVRCSVCLKPGHNRQTCKERTGQERAHADL